MDNPLWVGEAQFTGFGWVCVAFSPHGLCAVSILEDPLHFRSRTESHLGPPDTPEARMVDTTLGQIEEYLHGKRRIFDLPVDWSSMQPYQQKVLRVTSEIAFGEVRTYGQVAQMIGQPGAARAVGGALARNPMVIVIPCHRVVGSDLQLHGFSAPGGLDTKARLLSLEGHPMSHHRLLNQLQPSLLPLD